MEINEYHQTHHKACIEIFNSNTPAYFDIGELKGFETWLNGRDEKHLPYKNAAAADFYVIEHDGQIVGCGGFYIVRDSLIANMAWGMIHSAFHIRGFGKELFEYRVSQINTKYPEHHIILDTTQHTYQFFEKQGFSTTQIRKDYYGIGLDRYDMVLTR